MYDDNIPFAHWFWYIVWVLGDSSTTTLADLPHAYLEVKAALDGMEGDYYYIDGKVDYSDGEYATELVQPIKWRRVD